MEKLNMLHAGVTVLILLLLSLTYVQLTERMKSLENKTESLDSVQAELQEIRRSQDYSWMPGQSDLRIVGMPNVQLVLKEWDPYFYPGDWSWEWFNLSFELENTYNRDLDVLIELDLQCDSGCLNVIEPYAKGSPAWMEGWRQIIGIDPPTDRVIVETVPANGRKTIIHYLGRIRTASNHPFPPVRYRVAGTARLVQNHLEYTFSWELAEGSLEEITHMAE